MKKATLLLSFFCIAFGMQAQQIERQVIGSAGGTLTNGSVSMDYTVGELAVTTISNGTTTLTQGFHQGTSALVLLNAKVFFQAGLYNESSALMTDNLRSNGLIPLTSPYGDNLVTSQAVLDVTGNDAIYDWIWVELRDSADNTQIVAQTSALVQRDGDIVFLNGTSGLSFMVASGNYYVALKHRNHLGVMTNTTQALSSSAVTLDLTNGSVTMFGTNALTNNNIPAGTFALWAGDANNDSVVAFIGSGSDSGAVKAAVLGDSGNVFGSLSYSYEAYDIADVNVNKDVSFIGAGSDTSLVKENVLAHPGNFFGSLSFSFDEQLPENSSARVARFHIINDEKPTAIEKKTSLE